MQNLKIGTRLILSFAIMLVFIAIIAGVGIWRTQASDNNTTELTQLRLTNERITSEWSKLTALNAVRTIANARITDPNTIKYFEDQMKATSAEITKLQNTLKDRLTEPEGKRLYAVIQERRAEYVGKRTAALEQRKAGNEAAARAFYDNELEGLLDRYSASINDLLEFQKTLINTKADTLHNDNILGLNILIGVAVVSLALGLLLAWMITRSITAPLSTAVSFAEKVSQRDLSSQLKVSGKDEIAALMTALQRMNANLLSVIREVKQGADSIATASGQIAAGNLDLSSRTEEQASSLAETAATMEELTTTVKQNADNARQANGLAESAASVATRSGEVVSKVVHTMGAINTSSKQIVDIISVIDSIAFQTNILALNAAVEAARAGEQGKGFAVVASEVRTLAQRSAQAAKEIKGLIDKSVSITEEGNRLVSEAGQTMEETVTSIRRVTDIMGEITAASQEQSIGIDQINQAVSQMDQVTQQNAALVQEASAASDSMQDQARHMAELVATFRISDDVREIDITPRTPRSRTEHQSLGENRHLLS
ncbi:methyl-accepting chemotaxis protein [Neopusillimonas aromaticivorans]|uniref:methyl-accepting chemotaxis protein n=1 Tax=Neopusillimonas aromaticivorans TaxID=2979868 RepID=UPI002593326E|nr:methyl-accepting chemotaxis protein [Neopusillimonas aromaticivorans]WJJ94544.1 methyl-accepting chemotaxis protein [Neopusillimonas aromaticivorans]